jgi:DNA-binding Lrp family transcriptional regulator
MIQESMPDIELNGTDRAILSELVENGRATTNLLSDVVDKSRPYTGNRVRRLREHEYIEEIAPRLYDVTDKGRAEVSGDD